MSAGRQEPSGDASLPSNWGRWGEDDERGTLNLIDDAARARAAAEARLGRTVPLGRPIDASPLVAGPFAPQGAASVGAMQTAMFTGSPPRALAEQVMLMTHHIGVTHLDALSHIIRDDHVYPGRRLADCATPAGVLHGSTAVFGEGILTRGVLLDLASEGPLAPHAVVDGAALQATADRHGVRVEAGDALVVRGGWEMAAHQHEPMPGISLDAVAWMHRHDVALYAGDIGDARPAVDPAVGGPLHHVALHRLGMPLIDVADPEELAAVCAELGRWTFMFVAAPLRLQRASGVPVNPLAVF